MYQLNQYIKWCLHADIYRQHKGETAIAYHFVGFSVILRNNFTDQQIFFHKFDF
jgi:hypothetical protein